MNSARHIVSIKDISKKYIETLFERAEVLLHEKSNKFDNTLSNKRLGIMFFQPSTRTRLSFEAAMQNLGGKCLGFSDVKTTRSGDFFRETLSDSVKVIGQMVDCIIIRHYETGSANLASEVSPVPVINCGDGTNEHPTQALIDLWTLKLYLGSLTGICLGIVGNPSTRVIRSLLFAISKFKPKSILFLLPPEINLSKEVSDFLDNERINFEFCMDICDLLKKADAIEMLPIYLPDLNYKFSEERSDKNVTPERFRLTKKKLNNIGRSIPILHPGPRLDEMSNDIDDFPNTLYFKQVKNSVYLRMALFLDLFNI